MIIDTESEEGRALVALAKFGRWALDSYYEYCADLDGSDIQIAAEEFGLTAPIEVTDDVLSTCVRGEWDCPCEIGDNCNRYTNLAKLPEEELQRITELPKGL